METWRLVFGLFVSTVVGAIALYLIIDRGFWPYISKKHNIPGKIPGSLTLLLGIFERGSYTVALILYKPEWIFAWLGMKVAVGWRTHQERKSPSDNLYLIGNILSIMFGLIGAWIALGSNSLSMKD